MKDYAREFYNSGAWRGTSSAYMASQHYVCERCGGLARMVHHRTHIEPWNIGNPLITLDWANLEALCIDCHNVEHGTSPECAEGLRFDDTGDIVPIGG